MRILLDEMYDPAIAEQLSKRRGIDARPIDSLRGTPDPALFAFAVHDERALVTENVADFVPLAQQSISSGQQHFGLILTSNRSFPRARPSTTGEIVKALSALDKQFPVLDNQIVWLTPTS